MSIDLKDTSWLRDEATRTLLDAFRDAKKEIRFVGGCVRDALLGTPVHDIDAATPALPEEVIELCEKAWIKVIPTGIAHGTVTAIVQHVQFEITTLRKDVSCDGRHAEVAFTDQWEEDAARRDFTMNALYCDGEGRVYDYHDGVMDAYAGRIRFIGNPAERIEEDGLRILRFFRFMATHGIPPAHEKGAEACRALAHLLRPLSGERVQQEMVKLLSSENPLPALKLMLKADCFPPIELPEILPIALEQLIRYAPPHPWLRLASMLRHYHDGEAACHTICEQWRLSNADRKVLRSYLEELPLLREKSERGVMKLLRRHGKEMIMAHLYLQWADEKNASAHADAYLKLLDEVEQVEIPLFPVTGADLIGHGIPSGPAIGQKLAALEASWEASNFTLSREELLERL